MSTERSSPIDEKAHADYQEVVPAQEPTGGLLSGWARKDHSDFFHEVRTHSLTLYLILTFSLS